jgi:phosphopantothenoylcysteine decarboxylase/phosphopantothenate--cysteine ligase
MAEAFPRPRVLIALSGSIAAYKVADLVSWLNQQGVEVRCILTEGAKQFVSPLVLETLSGYPAESRLWGDGVSGTEHIRLARWPELVVFAPATANLIGKLAHGLADDLVTTVALATRVPWLVAPAMNTAMWENPAVQENLQRLEKRGVEIIQPGSGKLACGELGEGKLATIEEIGANILQHLRKEAVNFDEPTAVPIEATTPSPQVSAPVALAPAPEASSKAESPAEFSAPPREPSFTGKKGLRGRLLITAGPTISRIDAVRYLTNPSTGRMGIALAEAALEMGWGVTLILGHDKGTVEPTTRLKSHPQFQHVPVETAEEMAMEAMKYLPDCDGVIATAAVLDYRVEHSEAGKIKRSDEPIQLKLVPSVDVLATLRALAREDQFFLGFAAETENELENAKRKLEAKKLDYVFVNRISRTHENLETGFGTEGNAGTLIKKNSESVTYGLKRKEDLARELLREVLPR